MQFDLPNQVRKFRLKHFLRAFEQQVATTARSTTAKDQNVLDVIKICIMGNAIAKVNAHALPNLQRAFVTCFQPFLHKLQLLCIGHVSGDFNPRFGSQAKYNKKRKREKKRKERKRTASKQKKEKERSEGKKATVKHKQKNKKHR